MRHRVRRAAVAGVLAIGAIGMVTIPTLPSAAGPPPDIGGDLFFVDSNPFDSSNESNVYNVDAVTAEATLIRSSSVGGPMVGAAESPIPEVIFATQPNGILVIDLDGTGGGYAPGVPVQGLAWGPVDGLLYGSFGPLFFTVDPQTAVATPLPSPPANLITGLAWREGLVYALDVNGVLLSFEPNGQFWSTVGQTDVANPGDNGLAWNPVLEVFYAIDGDGDLYTLDPTDGATTLVGSTGIGEGGGLAFVPFKTGTQPDGRIKKPGGGDVGDGVYGIEQTVTRTTQKGVVTEHLVKLQNDGNQYQAYVIDGDHGVADWRVRYRVRNQPVTDAVVDGEYVTRVLAPGEIFRMRVRVKPQGDAPIGGEGFAVEVSAANGDDPPLTDTVRAVAVASG